MTTPDTDENTDQNSDTYRIQIYADVAGQWRWRLYGTDGIEAASGEGFDTVDAAVASVTRALTGFENATIERTDATPGDETRTFSDVVDVPMAGGD